MNSYPHMCRQDHIEIGHSDSEHEQCPLCRAIALLEDCAEHFATLRKANVFVWPNHPLNPEERIAQFLRDANVPT